MHPNLHGRIHVASLCSGCSNNRDSFNQSKLKAFWQSRACKYDRDRAYFTHLWRAIPARKSLFKLLLVFSYSKNFVLLLRRGSSLTYLKFTIIWPILFISHACPSLSRICPERSKILSNFFKRIFLDEHNW